MEFCEKFLHALRVDLQPAAQQPPLAHMSEHEPVFRVRMVRRHSMNQLVSDDARHRAGDIVPGARS